MRILLVNYEYPPVGGGAATAAEAIAKALIKLGHSVVVLTGSYEDLAAYSHEEGLSIHRIPSFRRAIDHGGILEMTSFLITGLLFARAIIRRHRIEAAIVFFSLPCGPIGLLGRWVCRVPYIVSLRGADVPGAESSLNFVHRILAPIRRAILEKSVAVVANSEGLQRMAETVDPFPVHVIPNGVDTDFFVPAQSKPLGTENILRILFVGRLRNQKNLPLLLEQVARLPKNTFELHLVGDGPERGRLQCLAEKLDIAAATTWHGWLSRAALRTVYQFCDCLVNPSLYEGMPNVVLEAMACGLPVIVSNVSGNNELVVNSETGYLFDLREPDALRNALKDFVNDRALCVRLGANGRTRVTKVFSWRSAAEAYLALLPVEMGLARR